MCGVIDHPMAAPVSTADATFCATVSTSEAEARHILDALGDCLDSTHVVVGASEAGGGRWTVSLHFCDAPNETAVRALIGHTGPNQDLGTPLAVEERLAPVEEDGSQHLARSLVRRRPPPGTNPRRAIATRRGRGPSPGPLLRARG